VVRPSSHTPLLAAEQLSLHIAISVCPCSQVNVTFSCMARLCCDHLLHDLCTNEHVQQCTSPPAESSPNAHK
jgi:hypothetical protein